MPNFGKRMTYCALFCVAGRALAQQPDLPSLSTPKQNQGIQPPSLRDYLLPPNPELAVLPKQPVDLNRNQEYTLPELVDIAEREHPQTRVAWETAKNAALATGILKSTYFPRVSATIVGGYQGTSGNTSAVGFTASGSTSLAGTVSAVSMEWLLFDFGGRSHVVDASQKLAKVSSIAFTGEHQIVIYEVCVAYYAYNAARLRRQTNEASLQNAREIEVAAEKRYHEGVGTVLETTKAHQATALAQLNVVQAEGAEQDAYAALLTAMGVSPLETIRIAALGPRKLSNDMLQPIDQLVSESLARRPDVQAAFAAEQASQAAVKAAKTQHLPKMFVAGTGAYVSGSLGLTAIPAVGEQLPTLNLSGNHWNGAIIGGVTVPLFDAHQRTDAIQQAKNNASQAAATLDKVRMEAMRQVVAAQNTLRTSIAANRASATLVDAAQTDYEAALDAYMHDVGTVTEVLASQTQLQQAKLSLDESETTALTAAVTLVFASGRLGSPPQ
jgi:outer membrane protein